MLFDEFHSTEYSYAECHYAECHYVFMPNDIIMNVLMLSVEKRCGAAYYT